MGIAKKNRIKKDIDFKRIIDTHRSFANKYFVIYVNKSKSPLEHWKIGISVSKKVGKAHERVWIKRRVRESFYNISDSLERNLEFIVIARPIVNGKKQTEIQKQIKHVLKIAGVINE
ncbi:MAG: ribonuclease P protein component [Lactobacillaceae bacterium]|jgi:ribonuclease P protein component|nr:ribonuclease P protein component [Lactobacillaceae bacterium]